MMFAQTIIILFGLWLIGVSLAIVMRPHLMLATLRKMGSTALINYTELVFRLLVGACFMVYAPETSHNILVYYIGFFLALTAIGLMMIPRRWHNRYAVWWADRLTPTIIRCAAPFSFIGGLAALWLVLAG